MNRTVRHLAAAVAWGLALAGTAIPAAAQIATTAVVFPRGASSTVVAGTSIGSQTRDYVVRARAGQTMTVALRGSPIVFFNVLAPGSNDEAIFVGSTEGNAFSGTLSVSGPYRIRVYQMRATARRGQQGNYRLSIGIAGEGEGGGQNAGGGGAGTTGTGRNGLRGIAGMNSIAAIDEMGSRGFRDVDSFTTGSTQYGIFYNRATRVCAQLTMADGQVLAASNIRTHPKCR